MNILPKFKQKDPKTNNKFYLKILFYPIIFICLFFVLFSASVLISGDTISENIKKISLLPFYNFSVEKEKPLFEEERVNFLLLGMGGLGHDGPYLTDTIILASLDTINNKVGMISIPRDLSVEVSPGYWRKINHVNHFAEMENPDQGAEKTAEFIGEIFDLPIHYYVRVDFAGFEELINSFDGLDVYVDNSFTDYEYPAANYAYQTISFEKGWQHFDGDSALKFSRSRHGTNGEASDFARSKRQQKILEALKDKALSLNTFFSFKKISGMYDMYKNKISTNLSPDEMLNLIKIAKNIDTEDINNIVLDNSPTGPLYSAFINGAYLLLPKDDSYFEIRNLSNNIFTEQSEIVYEPTMLEIQNGTKIDGLAYRTSVKLEASGFMVVKIANAPKQNYEDTVIYDFTDGEKQEQLDQLKSELNTDSIYSALDEEEVMNNSSADFIIILGEDQNGSALSKL